MGPHGFHIPKLHQYFFLVTDKAMVNSAGFLVEVSDVDSGFAYSGGREGAAKEENEGRNVVSSV